MIPKKCHLYWDGSSMSWLNLLTIDSFHKYNPDWKITVYLTKQSPSEMGKNNFVPDYTGPDYLCSIVNYKYVDIKIIDIEDYDVPIEAHACQGSDNFRRAILFKEGGVYSDFDTIWLKSISDIENVECVGNPKDFECIVSFYQMTHGFHNVSNLIAEKHSGFIKSLIDYSQGISAGEIRHNHQALGSDMLNKLYPTLDSVTKLFPRVLAIPYDTFYPYSTYHLETLFKEDDLKYVTGNTLCVHWFNGNRMAKDYINKEDYGRKCSMTSILKKEGYL